VTAVEYKLDGDSSSLIASLEEAIREMAAATNASNDLKAATQKLTAEQKAAAAATKAAAAEAKKSGDAYSGVLSILRSFGGQASANVEHVNNLTQGVGKLTPALGELGTVLGAVGLEAAGAGLVVGGLAYGMVSLAEAAEAAKGRLEKMGVVVDQASADQLDSYAAGTQKLSVAFDQLEVASGSALAENIGAVESALADMTKGIEPAKLGLGDLAGRLVQLGPLAFLVQEAFDSLFGDEQDANRHLALQKQVHDEYTAELTDMAKVSKEATDKMLSDLKRLEDEDKRAIEIKHAAALQAQKDAAATEKATEQQYLSELRFGQSFYASLQEEAKKEEASSNHLRDLSLDDLKQRAEAAAQYAKGVSKQIGQEEKDYEKAQKARVKLFKDAAVAEAQAFEQMFSDVSAVLSQEYQDQLSGIDDQISKQEALVQTLKDSDEAADKARLAGAVDRLHGLEAEKKRVAYDEFMAERESAIGSALLQGAVAVVTALAQLGPIGGAIAASFIGATVATEIGIIQSQRPPAHDGGPIGADEFNLGNRRVRNGEAAVVFNQRAVQSGALEQAQRINRDQSGGGSGEVRLVLADAGRVVGELVARETRRPGSRLAAAFGRTGVVDPYGRSR
jgi:hypothetical protein